MNELDVLAAELPGGVMLGSGDNVLRGEGEWLFERDGGRRVLAQMRGDLMLSRKATLRWVFVLESRIAWLGDRGIPCVFGVAPCKFVVMAERLPRGVAVSPRRPVVQLHRRIAEDESFAEIVYPLDELRAENGQRETFSTHDSRWNANGAFVGYRCLLDATPPLDVRRLERADGPRSARLVSDNQVEGEGRVVVAECDDAPPTTCVLFGDWAAYRVLPYLAESFRRVLFVHLPTLDHELVEAERPDLVITLADESGLIDLPADVEAPRARELAARKL